MIGVQGYGDGAAALSRRALALLIGLIAGLLLHSATARAATAPTVEDVWAENAEISTATLKAEVNPGEAETSYRFEYGTGSSYEASVPVPDGAIASNAGTTVVGAELSDLQPGTTYHYRLAASNQEGNTTSKDHVFTTYGQEQSGRPDTCPNAAFRVGGISEALPDCRAYELVSPLDKNGGDVIADGKTNVASEAGNAIAYASRTSFGDTTGSGGGGVTQYVAFRNSTGWTTHAVTPLPAPGAWQAYYFGLTTVWGFSGELNRAIVEGYDLPNATPANPHELNLYLENATATQQLETVTPDETSEPAPLLSMFATYKDASRDLNTVTFETMANLLPEATGTNKKLYAFEDGALKLAGILPGNVIPAGGSSFARAYLAPYEAPERKDTVSRDGSRLVFMSPADGSAPPQLYMRKNGMSTVRISESEPATLTPEPQNVQFQGASADMHKVVFSTTDRLLEADPGGPGSALYLYTDGQNPESESNLTFIARTGNGFSNENLVDGISEDGSHIYFGPAGSVDLWDAGVVHPIGVGGTDFRTSADGRRLAFISNQQLTEHDNRGHSVLYLYDEASNSVTCVSCPPSGAAPTADVEENPAGTTVGLERDLPMPRHYLTRDGRFVFFSTADALVPQDTNKLPDVYEYDANTGNLALLTSGTGDTGSWLADASSSGNDVFIVTRQTLSRWDTDKLVDIYDARVDGGLPEPPQVPSPCAGDECQGTPSAAPSFATSSGFRGLGNLAPTPGAKPKPKPKPKSSSRRALARRLAACRKKPRRRARCEARVRRTFRTQNKATRRSRRAGR